MNITGRVGGALQDYATPNGAFYTSSPNVPEAEDGNWGNFSIFFDASRNWTGATSEDATGASSHAQGGGQAHSNMQPFRTAICWHRTA